MDQNKKVTTLPPRPEVYCSTDIETDGPIPGPHSMLSFGTVALDADGNTLGTFSANLETLPGAHQDPKTMDFWATCPEAYEATRKSPQPPEKVMIEYVKWLDSLPGKPVFVGYPAGFDFTFMYWYLIRFTGVSPYSFSALDMKSYAAAILGLPFHQATKRNFPHAWFGETRHSHIALEDAEEQGQLFISMLHHK